MTVVHLVLASTDRNNRAARTECCHRTLAQVGWIATAEEWRMWLADTTAPRYAQWVAQNRLCKRATP